MMPAALPVLVLVPPTWIGGLGVMRSLGRLGVPVHGLSHRWPSVPNSSRFCAGQVEAGNNGRPSDNPERDVEALLTAGRRLGIGTILIAGTDEWAVFVSRWAGPLSEVFRFPRMPKDTVAALASKEGLASLAHLHGVPTPKLAIPRDRLDAAELAATMAFPVFVKPVHSRPDVFYKAVANDPSALLEHYRRLEEAPAAPNVLFQEYIPGDDGDIWMFNGYFDRDSRCLAGFTGQKLRQLPAHMGHCSLGVCRQNPEVIAVTTRFLQAVGYRGIVDIGYRFDRRDGLYKVLDVNPRLGGAFRLFVDDGGLDVARALYLDFTGHPVPAVKPRDGRRWFREDSELVAFQQYRRQDGLRVRDVLRSYKGVEESSTFSWDDPMPFVMSMWRLAGDTTGYGRPGPIRSHTPPPIPDGVTVPAAQAAPQ
jgi:predicted ATP-grasp superfamily ATP-dependent carboligase